VRQRLFSTLILWTVILGSLWLFGAHAAVALVTVLSALTLHEFYGMMEKMGFRPFRRLGLTLCVLMMAVPFYLNYLATDLKDITTLPEPLLTCILSVWIYTENIAELTLVAGVVIACIRVLRERDVASRVEAIGSTVLGLLCVPFLLQYLVRILMLGTEVGTNLGLCLWLVAVSKFCDVGALLTGLAIGKHKMCPTISPKKSWEGAIGGVLISAGLGAGIAFFASEHMPSFLTPALAALLALPLAVATIVSDLMESALKRRADIKDTGKFIPGIGGAFDLTDSLLLTAPIAYYLFLLFV
jgi:phosphatidate cytidylyltransferase